MTKMRQFSLVVAIAANSIIFFMCVFARYGWENLSEPLTGYWSVYSFGAKGLALSYVTATVILLLARMLGARDASFRIWMITFVSATIVFSFLTYLVATALRGV